MQSFAPRYDSSRLSTTSLESSRFEHAPPSSSYAHVHAGPQGVAFVASSSSQSLVSSASSMPPSISSRAMSDGDNCLVPDLDRLRKLKAVVLTGDHPEYTAIIKPHALKAVSLSPAEAAAQYEAAGGVILAENGQRSYLIPEPAGPSAPSAEDTLAKSIKRSNEPNTEEDREDASFKRIKMEEPEPSLSIPHLARSSSLQAQTSVPTSSGPTGSPSYSHFNPKYPSSSLNLASRVEPTSAPPDRRGSLSISEASSSGPSTRPDSHLPIASDVGSLSQYEPKPPITHIRPDTYRPRREGTSPPRAIYDLKREPDSGAESSWLRSERRDHSSHADKDRRRARERDDERAYDREAYLERVHRDREEAARQREEESWERRQRQHSQERTYDRLGRTEPNAPPRWLGPRDAIDARFPPRSSVPPPFSGHPPPPPSASYSRASMAVYPSAAGPPPPSLHDNYVAAPYSASPPLHATLYERHGSIPGMPPFGNHSAGGGPPILPRDTYGRPSAPGSGSYRSDDPSPYRPDSASPFPSHPSFYQRGGSSPPPPPPSFARQNDIYREMQALQEKMAVLQKQAAQFDGGEGGPRGGGGPGPYGRPPPNPTPSMQASTLPSTRPLQCPLGSGPASYVRGQPPFRPVPPPPQASYGNNNDDSPPPLARSGLGSALPPLPPPAGHRSHLSAYERAGTPGGGGGYGGPLPPPPGGADYSPRGEGGRYDDERGYNRPRKMMDQAGGGGRWDVGRDRDWSRR